LLQVVFLNQWKLLQLHLLHHLQHLNNQDLHHHYLEEELLKDYFLDLMHLLDFYFHHLNLQYHHHHLLQFQEHLLHFLLMFLHQQEYFLHHRHHLWKYM
tara:strand:- start:306 stop:602 length:297 start_codon:yes stop_codon:yes gene_type:complete